MFTQRSSCIDRLQVEKGVAKSICSSIKCYMFGSSWHEFVHGKNNLPICHPKCLITILAVAVLASHSPITCI